MWSLTLQLKKQLDAANLQDYRNIRSRQHVVAFLTLLVLTSCWGCISCRRVDTALANIGQPRMPLTHRLFEFGSWMGGDRDGNPNVLASTTRDVVILAR